MTYLVTARKWRPMVFEDVVGQSHVATTLRNAIASNRLSHAYIFSGPRGVGKTTMARILAKAINCRSPKEFNPDNSCDNCQEITEGRSIDVLEIDGASNRGVDEIRNLRESVRYAPAKGHYKVYIIDEVHMLTKEAFNALLKTLEEPPPHIMFVFATTEVQKVPATILSRCQRFDFRRISIDEIMGNLRDIAREEKITITDDALLVIAKKADGSLRDAQSIFDQVVSFCGTSIEFQQIIQALNIVDEELYFRVTHLIRTKDTKGGLALVEEIINRGYDIKEFLSGLNEHFRNILITQISGSARIIETSEVFKQRYEEEARHFTEQDVFRLTKTVSDLTASLRWSDQPRFKLEVGLLQMIKMDSSVQIEQLLRELEDLKKSYNHEPVKHQNASKPQDDLFTVKAGLVPDKAGVKITGSVKASPPHLTASSLADPSWAPPTNTMHQDLSTVTLPEWSKPSAVSQEFIADTTYPFNEPTNPLRVREPIEKWNTVIETATKQKVAVGTMLRESHLAGIEGNTLRLHCPDDIHLSTLKKNREYLSTLLQQVYGAKMHLEASVSSHLHHTPSPKNEHPIIAALKRELGAEPIE
jgi:DNA polymerase-3 subunit gamma/tau